MSTNYSITEGPYSLRELATKVKLPQVVLVTQGFYGATDNDTISGGQVMVAFFIKRVKGVAAMHLNQSFHIPLNSAMQFSPVPSEGTDGDEWQTPTCSENPTIISNVCIKFRANNMCCRTLSILTVEYAFT